ncbi:inhibitor of sigma-G Gin [Paenibacillus crassostreae]|uniref:Inhibitor of sigma-G Gin n=2 Tax=Paenibacillus crassostreae TaxID=1763538 RepID=A0A167AMB7_9BACL|nr:sigma factor G inhibitor Gin [Paenibacillus crassostreae]AOZ92842.1 inhibitor of sigma-G Gin [Paenibacillus crassostreae]OAB71200.1 inhibitor of sigma-G Gin [Paenibacillus crassostreae]
MNDHAEHVCIICGQGKEEGIWIISQFICETCESEMVHTNTEEAKYRYFIHQMRKISMQVHA